VPRTQLYYHHLVLRSFFWQRSLPGKGYWYESEMSPSHVSERHSLYFNGRETDRWSNLLFKADYSKGSNWKYQRYTLAIVFMGKPSENVNVIRCTIWLFLCFKEFVPGVIMYVSSDHPKIWVWMARRGKKRWVWINQSSRIWNLIFTDPKSHRGHESYGLCIHEGAEENT